MGLSSSQARLLSLTGRMHDIEYKAQKLEAQKLQMANESKHVYKEYEDALNATKIQHKILGADGSASYIDSTYLDLCTFNQTGTGEYALLDINSDLVYATDEIIDAYNASTSAADFATRMTGITIVADEPIVNTPATPPVVTPSNPQDITLSRGQSKSATIGTDATTLTLTNPFTGSNYKYTITAATDTNANFEFLKNGRLVIKGDGLTIKAAAGQQDDIILLGENNNLNTNDMADIIRVGTVLGFSTHTDNTPDGSSNNLIQAGAGDDYITDYGFNTVQGSLGTDSYMQVSGTSISTNSLENVFTPNSATTDGKEGWTAQGGLGDCRLLSLINSLTFTNSDITRYATISTSGTNYTVTFNNYRGTGSNSTTFTQAAMNAAGYATGDGDIRIIEYGLNKLIQENQGKNLETCNWNTISEYMLGNSNMGIYYNTQAQFTKMWNDYQAGNISNLIVSTDAEDDREGIAKQHAYAVKNVYADYVELVNPWDDRDILRLEMADFLNYFPYISTFGSPLYSTGVHTNGGASAPTVVSEISTSTDNTNLAAATNIYAGDPATDTAKYNYYQRLYNLIESVGGCVAVPDGMNNSTIWLSNMVNSGFVYMKTVDSDGNWYDTNVATNTSLQEVSSDIAIKKAEAKYEADMRKIDAKDKKYDTDLAAIEAERNAIKTEIDTLKTVAKDNVDRTFKLFS